METHVKGRRNVATVQNKKCFSLVVEVKVTVYFVVTKKKYTPFSHTEWAWSIS